MTVRVEACGGQTLGVDARTRAGQPERFTVTLGERTLDVRVSRAPDGTMRIVYPDGREVRAAVTAAAGRHWVSVGGHTWALDEVDEGAAQAGQDAAAGGLEAPMPGKVLRVEVQPGASVEAGETLLIVEAMKMEHAIRAPHAGTVAAVHVSEGELVSPGRALVAVEPAGEAASAGGS